MASSGRGGGGRAARFFGGVLLLLAGPLSAACAPSPHWTDFREGLISRDGRVIDPSSPALITTSEGQAYGLFLALVNDDRDTFERLLTWTGNNLAAGDLSRHLPAWQWGRAEDGEWRVLDSNAASDADVWMAYALTEAARRWQEPRYEALGRALAAQVMASETVRLPGLGLMLLPGPVGFHPAAGRWRLNPSYLPVQVLRGLATRLDEPAWGEVADSAVRLLTRAAPHGFAPDWVLYDAARGLMPDADSRAAGSYNAIRVYLWVGMMPAGDSASTTLKLAYAPMHERVLSTQMVPEEVDASTGVVRAEPGPPGFAHAVLPLLEALADSERERRFTHLFRQHVEALPLAGYYNQVLRLFSQLWLQGRYRFAADGSLILSQECR